MSFWEGKRVLVTGGASFIGSHLVEELIGRGAAVQVADNFSSGTEENLANIRDKITLTHGDLMRSHVADWAVKDQQIVFHLASDHGGRGYVDTNQSGPASNLVLGGQVFRAALEAGVDKVVFASSGCVYPNFLQSNPREEVYLTEGLVKPPYDADNMYGWGKLMNELVLKAYYEERGMKSAICRFFTVYGPRGKENHAIIAMIARAFIGQDPFEVWGDGTQVRNWTYVADIVDGLIRAAQSVDDATAVNLGTMERVTVEDAARLILELSGHDAEIEFLTDKPTGPLNRVADNTLAHDLLGWEPWHSFREGVQKTIDWYFSTKNKDEVARYFEQSLTRR